MKYRIEIEIEQGNTPLRPDAREMAEIMHYLAGELADHTFENNEARIAGIFGRTVIWRIIPIWSETK